MQLLLFAKREKDMICSTRGIITIQIRNPSYSTTVIILIAVRGVKLLGYCMFYNEGCYSDRRKPLIGP